jgi:hypothetical protein
LWRINKKSVDYILSTFQIESILSLNYLTDDDNSSITNTITSLLQNNDSLWLPKCGVNMISLLLHPSFGLQESALVNTCLIPKLTNLIDSNEGSEFALTTDMIRTYINPEVELASILSQNEIKTEDIKITNADRKKDTLEKGKKSFGTIADDEEILERIKQEKMKKLNHERGIGGSVEQNAKIQV